MMDKIYINTDGGARGNPGPAAIGIVFFNQNEEIIYKHKETIGTATNNQAEYKAIIKALELLQKSKWFRENNHKKDYKIICRLDSQLVVEQISGNYKIKNDGIKELIADLKRHLENIGISIEFLYIPRNQNKLADKLVNLALDSK